MSELTYKIICVDDEEVLLTLLGEFIASLGYEPVLFTEPKQVEPYLLDHSDSTILIISDLIMPVTGGLELRQSLQKRFQDVPFAILSGQITKELALQGLERKICGFLNKPYVESDIKNLIETEALARKEILEERHILSESFIGEASEILEEVEPLLLSLETESSPETLNHIFRLVHTIKGSSGVLDWSDLTKFFHAYEDVLSSLKVGEINVTPPIIDCLLSGLDHMTKLISHLKNNGNRNIDFEPLMKIFDVDFSNKGSKQEEIEKSDDKATKQPDINTRKKADDKIQIPMRILSEFMELSGEITVIRNMVNKLVTSIEREFPGNNDVSLLSELLEEMHKINSSMQGKVTELRKIPVSKILQSVPRTVRDLSVSLKKPLDLIVSGGDLRIDTSLAQVISGSLIHIIRNSADHGIESPEIRKEKGKPAKGSIQLSVEEIGETIVITVDDDGAGVNTKRVTEKAIESGLFSPEEIKSMSEKEIVDLIFHPGFSTAQKVTGVSGRGVGMDMVKSSIDAIGGSVEVKTTEGKGSRFTLTLPLPKSVLIISSLSVVTGKREFAVPQDNIVRLVMLHDERVQENIKILEGAFTLETEDGLLPIIDLGHVLGVRNDPILVPGKSLPNEVNIIVAKMDEFHFAITVESIQNSEEIVVKKLDSHLNSLGVYAGATFLGDGKIGLIIDVNGIARSSGVKASAKKISASQTASAEEMDSQQDGHISEYLLCKTEAKGLFAIALSDIFRLEELAGQTVKEMGEQTVYIYRDSVMPLVSLDNLMGRCQTPEPVSYRGMEKIPAVVVEKSGNFVGVTLNSILDIAKSDYQETPDICSQVGLSGNIILEKEVASVINLRELLRQPSFEFFDQTEPDKEDQSSIVRTQVQAVATSQEKLVEEAPSTDEEGWGLF